MKIAVAVTGASGAVYARLLVERLAKTEEVEELALIFTDNGKQVMEYEEGMEWLQEFSFIPIKKTKGPELLSIHSFPVSLQKE